MIEIKTSSSAVMKQKELVETLLDAVDHDLENEVIGEIGTDDVQYCKRVKYLDNVWVLVSRGQDYIWINQDNIPMDQLQTADIEEDYSEKQDLLQRRLDEIHLERDTLLRQQTTTIVGTPRSQSQYSEQ